jgi:hypothetical protein
LGFLYVQVSDDVGGPGGSSVLPMSTCRGRPRDGSVWSPGDTSYPGLTKIIASGTSTSGWGGIRAVGSLAAPLAEGKLLKSSERSAVDHCDLDPVYLRLGESQVHRGKRSRWQKECCWGCRRVGIWKTGTSPSHACQGRNLEIEWMHFLCLL